MRPEATLGRSCFRVGDRTGGSVILEIGPDKAKAAAPRNGAPINREPPAAFVLMAGGFSPPPLGIAAGCSVLDMHLTAEETVLDRWQRCVATLERAGVTGERLCLCGGSTPLPRSTLGVLRTLVDQSDYRGPAGALRDACAALDPESTIIAAEAARCCTADLAQMLSFHIRSGADVTVGRNADESPAGVYVLACERLDLVPHAGFMDLKEQWLSRLVSQGRRVKVYELPGEGALPLRTRQEFLHAVRACAGETDRGQTDDLEPRVLRERRCASSVICRDTAIAPDAVIVDSVILPGASVGRDALVARSIVGPGCAVRDREQVVDAVVGPAGAAASRESRR